MLSTCRSTTPSTTPCSSTSPGSAATTPAQRMTDPERVLDIWWAAFRQQYDRRRLSQRLHAPLRVRPRAAHRDARPADRTDEVAARRVVPHLRSRWRATASTAHPPRAARLNTGVRRCRGSKATRSPMSGASRTPDVAGRMAHRCCVRVAVDLSVACGPGGHHGRAISPRPRRYSARSRGSLRCCEVLAGTRIRATFAVPAVIARYPSATCVRSLAAEGHEIAAHGFRHEDVSGLDARRGAARASRARPRSWPRSRARKPAGWFSLPRQGDHFAGGAISPNTIDLLLEAGYVYFGNGLADDVPHYWVSDFASRRAMLTLPYYYHFDDQFFLHVPAQGHRPRKPGRAAAQLARRVRGAIQARPATST